MIGVSVADEHQIEFVPGQPIRQLAVLHLQESYRTDIPRKLKKENAH